MYDPSRELPERPDLRYLKLEAKRRLAAGEFDTLQESQLAIAREHGLPSWTALKEVITSAGARERHAFTQVGWVLSRFRDAEAPDWTAPDGEELSAHFNERFLRRIPPPALVRTLGRIAGKVREELVVTRETPLRLRAQTAELLIEAAVEEDPPHRLAGLRLSPNGRRVTDPRVATPPTHGEGEAPESAGAVAEESFAELGLVGLVLAGGSGTSAGGGSGTSAGGDRATWALARGWADLDRGEPLRPEHRFPVYAVTKLVTATAVLRLAATGRIGLDDAANAHLRTLRLADDTVTVRELLSHTGGVDNPDMMFADSVPDLAELLGTVVACDGPRGRFAYSNGGYAMLGQLIADVTGASYADAATRLVLEPLGMRGSWFPTSPPGAGRSGADAAGADQPGGELPESAAPESGVPESDLPGMDLPGKDLPENDLPGADRPGGAVVSGHRLADDGSMRPASTKLCVVPAAGGLWSSAVDLVRFGLDWSSLLPEDLAREALRPHASQEADGVSVGLGWALNGPKDLAGHPGIGPGAGASLVVRLGSGQVGVVLTNRRMSIEPVNARLARPAV